MKVDSETAILILNCSNCSVDANSVVLINCHGVNVSEPGQVWINNKNITGDMTAREVALYLVEPLEALALQELFLG